MDPAVELPPVTNVMFVPESMTFPTQVVAVFDTTRPPTPMWAWSASAKREESDPTLDTLETFAT
jgi:hypothetical protein